MHGFGTAVNGVKVPASSQLKHQPNRVIQNQHDNGCNAPLSHPIMHLGL